MLSDLKYGIIRLLLFAEAHQKHWKHGERSAICILNAKILASKPKFHFSSESSEVQTNENKRNDQTNEMPHFFDEEVKLECPESSEYIF